MDSSISFKLYTILNDKKIVIGIVSPLKSYLSYAILHAHCREAIRKHFSKHYKFKFKSLNLNKIAPYTRIGDIIIEDECEIIINNK